MSTKYIPKSPAAPGEFDASPGWLIKSSGLRELLVVPFAMSDVVDLPGSTTFGRVP